MTVDYQKSPVTTIQALRFCQEWPTKSVSLVVAVAHSQGRHQQSWVPTVGSQAHHRSLRSANQLTQLAAGELIMGKRGGGPSICQLIILKIKKSIYKDWRSKVSSLYFFNPSWHARHDHSSTMKPWYSMSPILDRGDMAKPRCKSIHARNALW